MSRAAGGRTFLSSWASIPLRVNPALSDLPQAQAPGSGLRRQGRFQLWEDGSRGTSLAHEPLFLTKLVLTRQS